MLNPFVDCGFEFRDVVENASPYTLSGDFGEEPLDKVEPGVGRRREVQDEAFVNHRRTRDSNVCDKTLAFRKCQLLVRI